ncbi:MAG: hypothetical protein Q8S15_09250 [Erysipelotrichaceae bacterium]|nr:hypothetical protein [Erysipelotrichaceae bacterium]MDP3306248.1 hypothetical protein [Erysipelotrichaceae bacterium]
MKIFKEGIVSNSDMIKNYRTCREKSEKTGRLYIFKNNQLDAVLFSLIEFEKLTPILEYFESLSIEDNVTALNLLQSLTHPAKIKSPDFNE